MVIGYWLLTELGVVRFVLLRLLTMVLLQLKVRCYEAGNTQHSLCIVVRGQWLIVDGAKSPKSCLVRPVGTTLHNTKVAKDSHIWVCVEAWSLCSACRIFWRCPCSKIRYQRRGDGNSAYVHYFTFSAQKSKCWAGSCAFSKNHNNVR